MDWIWDVWVGEGAREKKSRMNLRLLAAAKGWMVPPFWQNLECGSCLQALLRPSVSGANDTQSFWFHFPSTWGYISSKR